jgi:hypothetical protein
LVSQAVSIEDWAAWATVASALALIVTLVVFILQLRVKTKSIQQNLAVSLLTHLTSETFAKRRKQLFDTAAKYSLTWQGYDDSLDDFESRSFAYTYELIAQMVEREVIPYDLSRDLLQYSIVADWRTFEPINAHLSQRFHSKVSEWDRFRRLAERVHTDLDKNPETSPARR